MGQLLVNHLKVGANGRSPLLPAFFAILIMSVSYLTAYAAQGDFVYDRKDKADPFLPLVSKEGVYIGRQTDDLSGEIILEGIVWDPQGESIAIINGAIVKEGDSFSQLKILEIGEKGIRILSGDQEIIVNLIPEKEEDIDEK